MHDVIRFLPLAGILLLFSAGIWFLVRWERKQATTWTAVAEGALARVEHGFRTESRRSGAMVHTTSYYRVPTTTIVFDDGQAFVLRGRPDLPAPGARIRVWRNGLGGYRLERLA